MADEATKPTEDSSAADSNVNLEITEENDQDLGDSPNSLQVPSSTSRQAKIDEILSLKTRISTLIENIRDTKLICEKFDNENQYLQDYVGNYMKTNSS